MIWSSAERCDARASVSARTRRKESTQNSRFSSKERCKLSAGPRPGAGDIAVRAMESLRHYTKGFGSRMYGRILFMDAIVPSHRRWGNLESPPDGLLMGPSQNVSRANRAKQGPIAAQ